MQRVQEIVDSREWVSIFSSGRVELPEVDAKAETSVLFTNHYYWRGPGTVGGANNAGVQHLLDLGGLLPSHGWILSPVWLSKRRSMGLYGMF